MASSKSVLSARLFLSYKCLICCTSIIKLAGFLWGGGQSGAGCLELARVNVGFDCRTKINLKKMHRVSTVFSQIYKIDIQPLTIYCKGILCWKKNVLMFAITSLEDCFVGHTSGSSKLKVLITSLLGRSWEIKSFARRCYTFHPLGK